MCGGTTNDRQIQNNDMTDNLLVPVDSFDPWARAIAETVVEMESPAKTTVHLIHTFGEAERQSTADNLGVDEGTPVDNLVAQKSSVKAAEKVLLRAGFDPIVHGAVSDDPGHTIVSWTESHDTDRVYAYSRKRSPVGKAVFGSAIQELLFNAAVPVIVLPADAARQRTDAESSVANTED